MEINVLVLCGVCIFLLIMNLVEQWQHTKRENDLLDRLMANSHDDYMRNRIIASSKPKKSEYIGEVESKEEASYLPVD